MNFVPLVSNSTDSDHDVVYESGNYAAQSGNSDESADTFSTRRVESVSSFREDESEENLKRWKLNYHEAAIYLQVHAKQNHFHVSFASHLPEKFHLFVLP